MEVAGYKVKSALLCTAFGCNKELCCSLGFAGPVDLW